MRDGPAWRRYLQFWGPDVDREVDDELQFHIEMRAREYEARGMDPEEARRTALERFGDVERTRASLRAHDRRRERGRQRREWMSDLTQDLRYGLRGLLHSRAFTGVAVLTLALGIGATTAIFSVVNGVVLRPLPYPDADRVVMIWMDNRRTGMHEDIHSWPNFADYRAQNRSFTELAGYYPSGLNVTGGCIEGACEAERVTVAFTTPNLFSTLGVHPRLGRGFTTEEDAPGRDGVVVIGDGLWRRLFGADPGVIGRTVRTNGRERTVVGVMPRGFAFPTAQTEMWAPIALDPEYIQQRSSYFLYAVGRLKPGVPLDRARSDMSAVGRRLEEQYPESRDLGAYLVPLPEQVIGPTLRRALWIMLGAVGAVLLIACANVANLMLSRAAAREREVGVRLALGAGRARIVRQLLTESVLLAALGGALGVALAWGGLRILTGLAPADIPRLDEVRIDILVLGVMVAVTLLTGLAFGMVPALQASRPNLTDVLREGGRGGTAGRAGQRVRRFLAASQVALVVVLLTGAGLLIRSFIRLQEVQLGFQPANLLTMRLAASGAKYQQPPARVAFFESLIEKTRALPGVTGVGAISDIFLSQTPNSTIFTIEGRARTTELANVEVPVDAVTPDYFQVMGIPLRRGRAFTAQDRADSPPVVIINENMAKRFWPTEDAIGKRFKYGGEGGEAPWMTIVGVVGDMRRTGYDAPVRYETFVPHSQQPVRQLTLAVRTARDPLASAAAVRAQVRALDPDLPVYELHSMDQLLSEMIAQRRFSMALLGTFAGLALLLGVIGVYGVTAYLVAQRTREVGLRIALGAQPEQLVRMVVGQGMRVALAGLVVGLVGAFMLTRLMAGMLYGVSPTDLATLAGVTALLALATFVANYLPARRAARVDPLVALRSD